MADITEATPPAPGAGPRSPAQFSRRAWFAVLKRTGKEFNADNAWDWAAALTYYSVLSIFPGILVLVSIVGLASRDSVQPMIDSLSGVAPGPVRTIINAAVTGIQEESGKAGLIAVVSLAVALWSASGYVAAFMRASNAMYDVPEGRPIWKTVPIRLGITAVTGLLLVLSATIVLVTGGVARAVGRALDLESTTVTVWGIAKWPVLVLLVGLMFALLYWASPNARQSGFRWVSPGGGLAVILWMVVSVLFGVYAANFASYDKTYGTLAGVAVFLVWLWLSNLAILLGVEFGAELERQRAIAAGHPPTAEPYLRLRDDRAVSDSQEAGLGEWSPDRARRGAANAGPTVPGPELIQGSTPDTAKAAAAIREPDQLRAEIERTRSELAETAGALAAKLDVKAQLVDAAGTATEAVKDLPQAVRRRPFGAAVAVAAIGGVATALWALVRGRRNR